MNNKSLIFIVLLMQSIFFSNALAQQAANQAQLDSIAQMGKLNATALQCSYIEQMQRIKQALILNLPKKRALGDWFESSTRAEFMNFMSNDNRCGSLAIFTLQVDDAISELEHVFKK